MNDELIQSSFVSSIDVMQRMDVLKKEHVDDWRNGRVLWIQSVFVEAQHRGKGIYRKLYEHIKELVQHDDTDFRGIRLYVD